MPSSAAIACGGNASAAAAAFSRKCASDDVPGIGSMFGGRWSSHANATCIGVAPSVVATWSRATDCSGEKPPSGKNGTFYYARVRALLDDLGEIEGGLLDANRRPLGRLRIDVPVAFAVHALIPALDDFHARYPDIRLEVGCSDRPVRRPDCGRRRLRHSRRRRV